MLLSFLFTLSKKKKKKKKKMMMMMMMMTNTARTPGPQVPTLQRLRPVGEKDLDVASLETVVSQHGEHPGRVLQVPGPARLTVPAPGDQHRLVAHLEHAAARANALVSRGATPGVVSQVVAHQAVRVVGWPQFRTLGEAGQLRLALQVVAEVQEVVVVGRGRGGGGGRGRRGGGGGAVVVREGGEAVGASRGQANDREEVDLAAPGVVSSPRQPLQRVATAAS